MATAHQREIDRLKKRTSFAWAKYYEEMGRSLVTDTSQYHLSVRVIENIPESLPTHIIKELEDNIAELKKKIECPICLEIIERGSLDVSNCGHKYCKGCLSRLKETTKKCAICRKKLCK